MKQLLLTICFLFVGCLILSNFSIAQSSSVFFNSFGITLSGTRVDERFLYNFDSLQYDKYYNVTDINIPVKVSTIPFSFDLNILNRKTKDYSWNTIQPSFSFDLLKYKQAKLDAANLNSKLNQAQEQQRHLQDLLRKQDSLLRIIKNPAYFNENILSSVDSFAINPELTNDLALARFDSANLKHRTPYRMAEMEYASIKDSIYKILRVNESSEALKSNNRYIPGNTPNRVDSVNVFQPDNLISADSMAENCNSKFEKFITHFQSIRIGKSYIDNSFCTIKDYSIIGGSFTYYTKPYYLSFAAGKENYEENNIFYNSSIPSNTSVLFISSGIGNKSSSHLHFSYSKFSGIQQYSYQRNIDYSNQILSLELNKTTDNGDFIEGEIATSSFGDEVQRVSIRPGSLSHSSLRLNFENNIEQVRMNISGRVISTGTEYATWGNKFLLPGSNSIDFRSRMDVSNKLKLDYQFGYFNQSTSMNVFSANRFNHSLTGNYSLSNQQSVYIKLFRSTTIIKSGLGEMESIVNNTKLTSTGESVGFLNTVSVIGGSNIFQISLSYLCNQVFINEYAMHQYSTGSAFANLFFNRSRYTIRLRSSVIISDYPVNNSYMLSGGAGGAYKVGKKWLFDLSTDISKDQYNWVNLIYTAMMEFAPTPKWRIQQQLFSRVPLNSNIIGSALNRLTYRFGFSLLI